MLTVLCLLHLSPSSPILFPFVFPLSICFHHLPPPPPPPLPRPQTTEVLDTSGITKIEELSDESQIDLLSVRQLKTILQRNCIDYRGCVEKTELMERVHRLYQERADQKGVYTGASLIRTPHIHLGQEDSVPNSDVSWCKPGTYLGWHKVSCLLRCPHFHESRWEGRERIEEIGKQEWVVGDCLTFFIHRIRGKDSCRWR